MSGTSGYNTLLLDQTVWDLVLDASGNIAVATPPYAVAQDVATACRTFLGEVYYDTTLGVPWRQMILGKLPPLNFIKQQLVTAALTVPGVTNPVVYFSSFTNRKLSGQVQFIDPTGATQAAAF
jgi:hypothetical protein